MAAIEIGRAGLVLRGLSPIIANGDYLGSVEFMQGLNSIIRDGKKKDITKTGMTKNYYYTSSAIKDFKGKIVAYAIAGENLDKVKSIINKTKSALIIQVRS